MEYRARAKDFAQFLDDTVYKVGYLIGTRGQLCTQRMIDARLASTSYQGYWATLPKAVQWIDKIVVDCYGWYEMFLNGGTLDNPLSVDEFIYEDKRTGDAYSLARVEGLPNGLIATLPRNFPYPIAVGYTGHVGYFYKGVVYQAAGHKSGTIKTELSDTAHNSTWRYWYYLPWLDYSEDDMVYCKRGDKSDKVRTLQESLVKLGYKMINNGITYGPDGSYGGATANAVQSFKSAHGIPGNGDEFNDVCLTFMLTLLGQLSANVNDELSQAKIALAKKTTDLNNALTRITQIKVKANEILVI